MSKPRAQASREAELELLRTLDRARAAANTLYQTETVEVDFGNRVKDITFAPREDVQAEVRRLSSMFGLLLWTDNVVIMRSPDGGLTLSARFTLFHLDSGACKVFEFEGLCFPLSESNNNAAWAGEASVSYAERNAGLRIFGIPVKRRAESPERPHPATVSPTLQLDRYPLATASAATRKLDHHLAMSSPCPPYNREQMLEWLHLWTDHQRDMTIGSGFSAAYCDAAMAEAGGQLAVAWAACRRSAKGSGRRPLMPGDKPAIDVEYKELHDFLYAELLRDGLLKP